jgi:hypothetical protein
VSSMMMPFTVGTEDGLLDGAVVDGMVGAPVVGGGAQNRSGGCHRRDHDRSNACNSGRCNSQRGCNRQRCGH